MKLPSQLKAFLLNPPASHGLVFDLDGMEQNAKEVKSLLPKEIVLMAVKSFPHSTPLKKILPQLNGADVSNINEFNLVKDILREGSEVWFTRSSLKDFKQALSSAQNFKLWFTLENDSDLGELLELKKSHPFKISLRLNSTVLLEEGRTTNSSRFGLDPLEAASILPSVQAIHFHHGSEANDAKVFKALAEKSAKILKEFQSIERVNFGGGWNLKNEELIDEIKKINFPIVLEPGRFFSEAFGYAFSEVKKLTKREGCLFIDGNLSVATSLKWARNLRMISISSGNQSISHKGKILYGGPTCFEGDTLIIEDNEKTWQIASGDHLLFHPVPGYSYAWNKDFNGIITETFFISGGKNE